MNVETLINDARTLRHVYVAGRYSADLEWDRHRYIMTAKELGLQATQQVPGIVVVIPHANTGEFWGTMTPEYWYSATLSMMLRCDAVLLVDNWRGSKGSRMEVEVAKHLGIPVFYSIYQLKVWQTLPDILTTDVQTDPSSTTRERVIAAAIYLNGTVYHLPAPARHHDILQRIPAHIPGPRGGDAQGFITSNNRFVTRTVAAQIALAAGQVKRLSAPPLLFSEELW